MKIQSIHCSPKPSTGSKPGLAFEIDVVLDGGRELLIEFSGSLYVESEIIAPLHRLNEPRGLSQWLSGEERNPPNLSSNTLVFYAQLTPSDITFLENTRRAEPAGDMILKLQCAAQTLQPKVLISRIKTVSVDQMPGPLLYYKYEQHFHSHTGDMWLMSADGSPKFLESSRSTFERTIRIPESDWIQKFSPALDLGTTFVSFFPRLPSGRAKATDYLEKAAKALQSADYKAVFAHVRELGTHLNNAAIQSIAADSADREKWNRAYKDFNHMASLGLHTEDMKYETELFSRDAEYVYFAAQNLTRYFQSLVTDIG